MPFVRPPELWTELLAISSARFLLWHYCDDEGSDTYAAAAVRCSAPVGGPPRLRGHYPQEYNR